MRWLTDVFGFRWYRRARIWVAPAFGAGAAVVVGLVMLLVDRYVVTSSTPLVPKFVSSADTARTLLSVTATSIATLTALVLTIVTIVLQLASDKYSHRALRTFLQDRESHVTLATFVGTFTYAVLVLLGLDAAIEEPDTVVGVAIPVAFALAVLSIAIFVHYIDHIVHAARGASIIERVGNETREEIDRLYPATLDEECPYPDPADPPGDEPDTLIRSPRPGVVYELDTDGLVTWALEADATLVMRQAVGDFTPGGAPLLELHGDGADGDRLEELIHLDAERTIRDDIAFGFRLLVDIAEHAISPAINDPTTAVQCIDQLHDLLWRLARRHLPTGWYADDQGTRRLYVPQSSWEDLVSLACDEIRLYGERDLQVQRRLRAMLGHLLEIVPEGRREPLEQQLRLLDAAAERSFADEADRTKARMADAQGIGGGTAAHG